MNVVINLAGNIAFNAPGTLVEQTAARLAFALARDVQPICLFVAVPAYLVVGVMWGALYGVLGRRAAAAALDRLAEGPGVRGSAAAGLGAAGACRVLGLGLLGVGATGPVAFSGELIRHAAFGVLLGLMYPVFRARRPVKVRAHTPAELTPEPAVRAEV